MSEITMKSLLESGVHFGHQTRKWDPRMAPYIYTKRNEIHILDAVHLATHDPSHRQPLHRSYSDENQDQLMVEILKGYHEQNYEYEKR